MQGVELEGLKVDAVQGVELEVCKVDAVQLSNQLSNSRRSAVECQPSQIRINASCAMGLALSIVTSVCKGISLWIHRWNHRQAPELETRATGGIDALINECYGLMIHGQPALYSTK